MLLAEKRSNEIGSRNPADSGSFKQLPGILHIAGDFLTIQKPNGHPGGGVRFFFQVAILVLPLLFASASSPWRPPTKIADLNNQYDDDRVLRRYLARVLPSEVHTAVKPDLRELGALAGDELYDLNCRIRKTTRRSPASARRASASTTSN
jgi:hypothetical protein